MNSYFAKTVNSLSPSLIFIILLVINLNRLESSSTTILCQNTTGNHCLGRPKDCQTFPILKQNPSQLSNFGALKERKFVTSVRRRRHRRLFQVDFFGFRKSTSNGEQPRPKPFKGKLRGVEKSKPQRGSDKAHEKMI